MSKLYPFRLKPVYKDYIWGGKKIAKKFHRKDVPSQCAESWEVSDRSDGMSVVVNGAYEGYTLHKLIQDLGSDLLGSQVKTKRFPLLIKLIDAAKSLSIQVHPNDRDAAFLESEPKTECWIVLDASEGAAVYAGFKKRVTKEAFEKALKKDQVLECLKKIEVEPGDVIYVPGGSVHAILSGCLILEVQQNSNTTYRVYDWGRDRELHLEKAMQVIQFGEVEALQKMPKVISSDPLELSLVKSSYFSVERIELKRTWKTKVDPKSFEVYFCLSGQGEVELQGHSEKYREGMTFLIPAKSKEVVWTPSHESVLLRMTL